ncbi:fibronectin type III domain-containing protein [Thermaurantimonas aggregans]|uniref:fibronectin type III domain-containing protein n=1 Tax=Thermaurantimonas aggregans TaxID=2173829 RepID=UPI0023F18851|nr:fibronectin type III domain-containing protein [Thermaurantimonas aggregans]MCX8148144.1 fibronectin type III domain-containing protein [Thermaurantimonas aggregans]
MARDLQANGNASEIRLETIGTAPNRICVVQWTNYRRFGSSNTADTINFQIRLHETTNSISIVYGRFATPNTSTTITGQVGLRGFSNADFRNVTTTSTWANAVPGATNTAAMPFVSNNLPAQGLTYNWAVPSCFAPGSVTFTNITHNSATASWAALNPSIGYQLQFGPTPLTLGQGTTVTVTSGTTYNFTGLTSGVQMAVFIRNICSSTDTSVWQGPFTFTPQCSVPSGFNVLNADSTQITLGWTPNSNVTFELEYGLVGFTQGTGTLVTGITGSQYTVTGLTPSTQYHFYLRSRCDSVTTSNWTPVLLGATTCGTFTLPFYEDFLNWPPLCFSFSTTGTATQNWSHFTTGGVSLARANFWSWTSGVTARMQLPRIQLNQPAWIKYAWSHQYNSVYPNDSLFVEIKIDTSTTWTRLQSLGGPSFNTPGSQSTAPGQFTQENLVIPSSFIGHKVDIRFVGRSGFGPDVFIDFIEVENIPNCLPPSALSITNVTATSATATFTKNNTGSATQWEVGAVGFTPGSGLQLASGSTAGTTINITGLSQNTQYQLYIRDSCGTGQYSAWVGPVSFTTSCLPVAMPFTETFATWPPSCFTFSTTGSSTQNWSHFTTGGVSLARANFWAWSSGIRAVMNTPFVQISQPARLRFYWSHLYSSTYPADSLIVLSRNDSTGIADTILKLGGPTFNTPGAGNTTPATTFNEQIIDLPASYVGKNQRFEFHARSGFGPDLFIDEILVESLPACPSPQNFASTGNTATSATFSWSQSGNNASSWDIEWGPVGFTPGSAVGTIVNVTTNPATVSGLPSGSCIDFYIRTKCSSVNDSSAFVGPVTICMPIQFDVETRAVLSPAVLACGNASTQVRMLIRNQGFDPVTNVPVVLNITGDINQTLNATYTGTLQNGQSDTVTLGTINTANGAVMNIVAYTNLATDQDNSNDTLKLTATHIPLTPKADTALVCAGIDTITLKAQNWPGVSYQWFNSPTAQTPLATGPTFFVPSVAAQNTYYLEYGPLSGSQTFTYTAGDIQSDRNFTSLPGSSTCPGVMTINLPIGVTVDSISVEYDFTAVGSGWMSEQRSQLRCITTGQSEAQLFSGTGTTTGTLTYNRTGLTIANGVVTGPLVFELHAGRTFGGSGCDASFNFIPNNTWKITVFYTGAPCSNVRTPVTVGTQPQPTAAFTYTANNYVVNFTANVTNADSVHWTFGTAGSSSQLNPTFTFPANGVYPVCLKAFNNCGSVTTCDTLKFSIGLAENILGHLLKLYPNPSDGRFELTFSDDLNELPVRIIDLTGRTMHTARITSANGQFNHAFDLRRLPAGTYFVQIETTAGTLTRRIILQ